jgi:hypothetical protein
MDLPSTYWSIGSCPRCTHVNLNSWRGAPHELIDAGTQIVDSLSGPVRAAVFT